jgi:hypothetical protein
MAAWQRRRKRDLDLACGIAGGCADFGKRCPATVGIGQRSGHDKIPCLFIRRASE